MKKSRYTEEQVIGILKQGEAGVTTADLCREHGLSAATFYGWKSKFGGMDVSEAQRLKAMEDENRRLKLLVAELSLHGQGLLDRFKAERDVHGDRQLPAQDFAAEPVHHGGEIDEATRHRYEADVHRPDLIGPHFR